MDLRQYITPGSVDPQKILKIVLSVSIIMLVIWLFMVSRMEFSGSGQPSGSAAAADTASVERTESIRALLNEGAAPAEEAPAEERSSSSSIFLNAFTTFVVMMGLLAGVWFWSWSKSRSDASSGRRRELREMNSHMIGQGAQIKIVEMNGEVWVLGVTSENINLLHRYPADEWTEELPAPDENDEGSFYNVFKNKQ